MRRLASDWCPRANGKRATCNERAQSHEKQQVGARPSCGAQLCALNAASILVERGQNGSIIERLQQAHIGHNELLLLLLLLADFSVAALLMVALLLLLAPPASILKLGRQVAVLASQLLVAVRRRIELTEELDLFGVHVQPLGHYNPIDHLVAGRRCQRARVGVEGVEFARQQVVDGHVVYLARLLGGVDARELVDDWIEVGVALAVRLFRLVSVRMDFFEESFSLLNQRPTNLN